MKTTATLLAFVSPHSGINPADLSKPSVISMLTLIGEGSRAYFEGEGYTYAGNAEVSFEPIGMKELVENKIEALRNEAATIRAKATKDVTRIEGQIQNLLAIGFDESSVFRAAGDESDIPF